MRRIALLLAVLMLTGSVYAVAVKDDLGYTVELDRQARRIVTLAPHITETVFDLGLGDLIVATVEYSDYPAAAKSIPRIGNAFAVSIEAILTMQPDLVVAWGSGGQLDAIRKLRDLGVAVFSSEPSTLDEIPVSAANLALLAGYPGTGSASIEKFRLRLKQLKSKSAEADKPSVFLQISEQGLYTVNQSHLIGQAIELCGGRNIFADVEIAVPLVSMEAIIGFRPDMVVFSSRPDTGDAWKKSWLKFPTLPAVRNGSLFRINADLLSRPGFRLIEGVSALCELIDTVRVSSSQQIRSSY